MSLFYFLSILLLGVLALKYSTCRSSLDCRETGDIFSPFRENRNHQIRIEDINNQINDNDRRQLQARTATLSGTCTDGASPIPFETYALLNLIERPSLVSENDLTLLEETFVEAYNDLLDCNLPGESMTLDNATIISNSASNKTYPTLPTNISTLLINKFTYLLIVRGRSCNVCSSNTSIVLFSNSSSSSHRELHKIPDKSKREIPSSAIGSLKPIPSPLTRSMKIGACACQGPNESTFADRMSSLLLAASATNATTTNLSTVFTSVVGVSQLLNRTDCNANNVSHFSTTLVVYLPATQKLTQVDVTSRYVNLLIKRVEMLVGKVG